MKYIKNNLVDIPDDGGIYTNTIKNKTYVYKYTKHFRNNEGQSRHKAKVIGHIDDTSGKMIPNENYFDLYNVVPMIPHFTVVNLGYTFAVSKIAKRLGLTDILCKTFGLLSEEMLTIISYMVHEGTTMMDLEIWQQKNFFENNCRYLKSQYISRLFQRIDLENIQAFFKNWIPLAIGNDNICYDVTSISSYSENISSVEWGYNRDHESLEQFNVGVFCNENTKLPLYYEKYNGSITDKTNLKFTITNAKKLGISDIKLFLDGGFSGKECFQFLETICKAFTMGVSLYEKPIKEVFEKHKKSIIDIENALLGTKMEGIYCYTEPMTLHNVSGKIFLYLNVSRMDKLNQALLTKIEKSKHEISKLRKIPSEQSDLHKYFSFTKKGNSFSYELNKDKYKYDSDRFGFFALFSNDMDADPKNTLEHYRQKDCVEKIFDIMKNDLAYNRTRTHADNTTDGKLFLVFLSTIIRSHFQNLTQHYITNKALSLNVIFDTLADIQLVEIANSRRLYKAMTKRQKDIILALGLKNELADFFNE